MNSKLNAISIVDQYLEHARVMIFHNNGNEKVYISSADWMVRNLDHRIEVAVPINDKAIKKEFGADSIRIKMVIGGKAVYKHCTSAYEFRRLIDTASKRSVEADIEIQNLLHSKVVDIITSDKLPTRLYILGSAPNIDTNSLKKRMSHIAEYLDIRNRSLGSITIVNCLEPKNSIQNQLYINFYKARGLKVEE